MKITLKEIAVSELVDGYENNEEEGVVGYYGLLNIRPPYQREFVYKDKQRDAVIDSINKGYPLNTMYWAVNKDGTYEIIDGQQRTISICEYVNNKFSINDLYFSNLPSDKQDEILNYKLMVYICDGDDSEKLEWFEVINIAGEKLTKQELRNATYYGPWLTEAKRYFSKKNGPAYSIAYKYIEGTVVRQDFLETALDWISNGKIEEYMSAHQHATNADELWRYFKKVIDWVNATFPQYRSEMRGVDWGFVYREANSQYHQAFGYIDPKEAEETIKKLMMDEDVTKKSGIYYYIVTGDEKYLSIRQFSEPIKRTMYAQQSGICKNCGKHFKETEMEADHITPWSGGGRTVIGNCQMLCKHCNRIKSNT